MPPRIPISQASRLFRPVTDPTCPNPPSTLFGGLAIQTRQLQILASLSDNKGAYQKRIRLGRGPSSGKGKTSGRGHKGQKQHGHVHPWFQGGQTPLIVTKGKMGFENLFVKDMTRISLDRLQAFIDTGRIDPTKRITIKELHESRFVTRFRDGLKLLAGGKEKLTSPIDIIVSRASKQAIEAVEALGGKVLTRYHTKWSMRQVCMGNIDMTDTPLPVGEEHVKPVLERMRRSRTVYRMPDPTSRFEVEYYRDPAHRGYMSHMLKEGESPSLYYKVPASNRKTQIRLEAASKKKKGLEKKRIKTEAMKSKGEKGRLWD